MYKIGHYAQSKYYAKSEYDANVNDKYYAEKTGVWFGDGAERLGILGQPVLDGELDKLAKGLHPKTNEKIGKQYKNARPYFDGGFHSVKDFSMLYMLDETLGEKAYQEDYDFAESEALKYKESLAFSRVNSKNELVKSGLIIAKFQHETSRPTKNKTSTIRPDMQIHTHNVTSKWAVDKDGTLRNLYNKKIYTQQKVIGAVFRSALAHRLMLRGFEIEKNVEQIETERQDRKIKVYSFKVKGITDEQRKLFSKRKNEIDYLCDKQGITSTKLRDRVAQQHKSIKEIYTREELKSIWKEDAKAVGLTNESIQKLKTNKSKNFITHIVSDESLLKSVIFQNTVYDKDLLARLYENSQYTGIDVPKTIERMKKNGLLEKIGEYTYKCNVSLEKKIKADRHIRNRINVNSVAFAKEFTLNNQNKLFANFFNSSEDSIKLPTSIEKKKTLPKMIMSLK